MKKLPKFGEKSLIDKFWRFGREEREEEEKNAEEEGFTDELCAGVGMASGRSWWKWRMGEMGFGERG